MQQIFHMAPNVPLHIPGRSAVPFLTQSGVNRITLRSIWTAADPQNIGTLTQLTQFQLMLRLVSMAQTGSLDAEGSAESMREAVQQHSGRLLALPVFQSVVIPPHENLLAMYGVFVIKYQQSETPSSGEGTGFGLASSLSFGISHGISNVNSFGATSTVSIDNAFADLGPTTNAPLPRLEEATNSSSAPPPSDVSGGESPPPTPGGTLVDGNTSSGLQTTSGAGDSITPTPPAPVTDTDDDEFGDFEDVTSTSPPMPVDDPSQMGLESAHPVLQPATNESDDGFGASREASNEPLPSIGASLSLGSTTDSAPQPAAVEDDFGGFAAAPSAAEQFGSNGPAQAAPCFDCSVQSSFMDTGGGASNFMSTPQPTPQDDFGGFEGVPAQNNQFGSFNQGPQHMTSPSFDGSVQSSTMVPPAASSYELGYTASGSITDVFGDIAVKDAPLPPLDQFGPATSASGGAAGNEAAETGTTNAEDDFGGFETATVPSNKGGAPPGPDPNNDPFAGMPEIQNQPLSQWTAPVHSEENSMAAPSLETTAAPPAPVDQDDDDDDEEFGGFETAVAPVPAAGFGSFEQPLNNVPSFDGSIGIGGQSVSGSVGAEVVTAAMDDPFGGLAVEDAPLTPLGQFSPTGNATDSKTQENKASDDDFGGFGEASSMPSAEASGNEVTEDPFAGVPAVRIEPAQESEPLDPNNKPKNKNFMGFQDAPAHQDQLGAPSGEVPNIPGTLAFGGSATGSGMREVSALSHGSGFAATTGPATDNDDPFSAFDTISGPPQPELPPLAATFSTDSGPGQPSQVPSAVSEEDEEFGGFSSPSQAAPAESSAGGDDEDDFGDFESSNPPSSTIQTGDRASTNISSEPFASSDGRSHQSGAPGSFDSVGGSSQQLQREGTTLSTTEDLFAPAASAGEGNGDLGYFASTPASAGLDVPSSAGNALFGSFDGPTPQSSDPQTRGDASGVFDSPTSQINAVHGLAQGSEDDDFGAFDSAPALSPAAEPPATGHDLFESLDAAATGATVQTSQAEFAATSPSHDFFGAFDTAPSEPTAISSSAGNDDFGAFDSALSTNEPVAKPENDHDDDWGNFGSAPIDAFANEIQGTQTADDNFREFNAVPAKASETSQSQGSSVFDASSGLEKQTTEQDDEFGAFGEAPSAQTAAVEEDEDWGDFGEAPSLNEGAQMSGGDSSKEAGGNEDDFGAFDSTPASQDDWGDFENVAPSTANASSMHALQEQIRDLSMPLSESLLRKSDSSGGHVDLGESFEVNIGLSSPMDAETRSRVDRCVQVLDVLSKMNHNKGSSYWEQVLKILNEDLAQGHSVLVETKKFSREEIAELSKSLRTMVAALREYVRVSRSIVATIGDVLLLDPNALLTVDTMASTWCSLSILEMALDIESKWNSILKMSKSIPTLSEISDAPGLTEMRSTSLAHFQQGTLCELTLQPLLEQNKTTTMAKVEWNGRPFMACSANLLANRCPFFVASN